MKMCFCIFSGSCTGSVTGTTSKPEVPALPAELPASRVLSLAVGRLFLGGPKVPPTGPVLPVLRVCFLLRTIGGLPYVGR